jgi:glutamate synthase (NADPH/NADH) small chain
VKQGHEVTVFEARDKPGGMTRYGIPEYRLPYDRLDADVAVIVSMGVTIRYNTRIGSAITMADLERDYDAVLVAVGLQQGRSTRIPGSDHPQVQSAVSLLRMITLSEVFEVPRRAVVIGGGNVAMDIARSLARKQKTLHGEVHMTVTALEDFEHFLADRDEIREAREEGVELLESRGPKHCVIDDKGRLTGLATLGVESIFDADGRFAPRYDTSDEQFHDADMVIEAIGQMTDVSLFGDELTERLEWNRGRLQVDEHGRTSESWLWSAGDMVHGPDVVHAVADGHSVASSIEDYFK